MEDRKEVVIREISRIHVRSLWHWIKPGIEEINRICPDDYEPEDIFCWLWQQRATCFLILEDREVKGFTVLEVVTDPFKGRKTLNVWLLNYHGAEETQEIVNEFLDRTKVLAGCCRVQMKSPRLGYTKKLKGWKLKLVTWERE